MRNFDLNREGDIYLQANGTIAVIEDTDYMSRVRNVIQTSLRTFLGENFNDPTIGCDWIELFSKKETKSTIRRMLENEVKTKAFQAEPGLQTSEVEIVSILLNGETRHVDITIRYQGEEILI